jgi:BolA protein
MSSTAHGVSAAEVEAALRAAIAPLQLLEVRDDSAAHAGHAGAREGRHFSVRLVAPAFAGLSRLARHRLVYDALAGLMPRGVHALAIETRAPGDT